MPWWNCCCEGCKIFEDDFTRENADTLGSPWCEPPDSWSIFEYKARCDIAGSIALLDIAHPELVGSMVVTLDTIDEIADSNQKYRLILNAVKQEVIEVGFPESTVWCETDSYYFAEFERIGTNTSIIRLGVVSGGFESILKQDVVLGLTGFSRKFTAILSAKEFCASVTESVLSYVGTVPGGLFEDGHFCGMELSEEGMLVDNFLWEEHFDTNPECPLCLCRCSGGYFPPTLRVRVFPDPDDPDCERLNTLDPCEFEIDYDRIDSVWRGEGLCCDGQQGWMVAITCPPAEPETGEFDPYNTPMSIEVGCTDSCAGCESGNLPIAATCDPISLTYGPFFVAGSDLSCFCTTNYEPMTRPSCNYFIEISEI